MTPVLQSKLPGVGTTIFTVMSQLATEHKAVNLSQGFPDFEGAAGLVALVSQYMQRGYNQYAPMPGLLSLREEIAGKYEELYGCTYVPDTEVTITAGGSEAIFCAIASIIGWDDEVIIFEPAYDLYRPVVNLFGGRVVPLRLEAPAFTIDWEEVKTRITSKTKLIIINNPNNPSTKVLNAADMQQLSDIVEGTDICVLSDEVYEHIVFDNRPFESACKYPALRERTFITCSFGKLYHVTGWKVGYCIAPELLMKEFRKVHQFNVFSVHTPVQYALSDFIRQKEAYLGLASLFREKRDYFIKGMQGSRFNLLPSEGSYFILAGYSEITDSSDTGFAEWLTIQHRVASIPVSAFYSKQENTGLIRFCFAKKKETLDLAIERLQKAGNFVKQ